MDLMMHDCGYDERMGESGQVCGFLFLHEGWGRLGFHRPGAIILLFHLVSWHVGFTAAPNPALACWLSLFLCLCSPSLGVGVYLLC